MSPWQVLRPRGSVAELHDLALPESAVPTVWVMQPDDDALVLGSGQRDLVVDDALLRSEGLSLVRRRSGGGAVIIDSHTAWIDVLIPRGSGPWSEDLGQTFLTIGEHWVSAFADCGIDAELYRGRPVRSAVSDAVCFAGLGWGEVTVGGVKVVGLSQRRTRWGARVQCMAIDADHSVRVAGLLGADSAALPPRLGADATGPGYELRAVQDRFLHQLGAVPS